MVGGNSFVRNSAFMGEVIRSSSYGRSPYRTRSLNANESQQMTDTASRTATLRMYVNDMVALEKDILMALEKQKDDERVQGDPNTAALLAQVYDITKAHLLTMENHAAAMGGDGAGLKEAVASVAGTLAGIYDLVRKHPVSRMLRDDYT